MHTHIHPSIYPYIYTNMHTYIHTYIHAYIHFSISYMYLCIYTYTRMPIAAKFVVLSYALVVSIASPGPARWHSMLQLRSVRQRRYAMKCSVAWNGIVYKPSMHYWPTLEHTVAQRSCLACFSTACCGGCSVAELFDVPFTAAELDADRRAERTRPISTARSNRRSTCVTPTYTDICFSSLIRFCHFQTHVYDYSSCCYRTENG